MLNHLVKDRLTKHRTFAEADEAAKELIAKQPLEHGRQGEKHPRTDDTEEEYQEKKSKVEQKVVQKKLKKKIQ